MFLMEKVRANGEKLSLGLHNTTVRMYYGNELEKGNASTLQSPNIMNESDDVHLDNAAI